MLTEYINIGIQLLISYATDNLIPFMVLLFLGGAFVRLVIYMTIRAESAFSAEFEKRVHKHLSDPDYIQDAPNSFHMLTKCLLDKTMDEHYNLKKKYRRRRFDQVACLTDRIFMIPDAAKRLVSDTLSQTKYLRKEGRAPKFLDISRFAYESNPIFNRVLGLFPLAMLHEFLNILPGLFVIGGIFGTFLGVMQALPMLSNIDPTNAEATKQIMDAFLLKMAFSMGTSVVGIIVSVSMTILNSVMNPDTLYYRSVNKFTSSLEFLWNDTTNNEITADKEERVDRRAIAYANQRVDPVISEPDEWHAQGETSLRSLQEHARETESLEGNARVRSPQLQERPVPKADVEPAPLPQKDVSAAVSSLSVVQEEEPVQSEAERFSPEEEKVEQPPAVSQTPRSFASPEEESLMDLGEQEGTIDVSFTESASLSGEADLESLEVAREEMPAEAVLSDGVAQEEVVEVEEPPMEEPVKSTVVAGWVEEEKPVGEPLDLWNHEEVEIPPEELAPPEATRETSFWDQHGEEWVDSEPTNISEELASLEVGDEVNRGRRESDKLHDAAGDVFVPPEFKEAPDTPVAKEEAPKPSMETSGEFKDVFSNMERAIAALENEPVSSTPVPSHRPTYEVTAEERALEDQLAVFRMRLERLDEYIQKADRDRLSGAMSEQMWKEETARYASEKEEVRKRMEELEDAFESRAA